MDSLPLEVFGPNIAPWVAQDRVERTQEREQWWRSGLRRAEMDRDIAEGQRRRVDESRAGSSWEAYRSEDRDRRRSDWDPRFR